MICPKGWAHSFPRLTQQLIEERKLLLLFLELVSRNFTDCCWRAGQRCRRKESFHFWLQLSASRSCAVPYYSLTLVCCGSLHHQWSQTAGRANGSGEILSQTDWLTRRMTFLEKYLTDWLFFFAVWEVKSATSSPLIVLGFFNLRFERRACCSMMGFCSTAVLSFELWQ